MLTKGRGSWKVRALPSRVRGCAGRAAAALEGDAAGLVGERAAQAIDERALARAVRSNQADALAFGDVQIDSVERDESAEAFAEAFDLEEGRDHFHPILRRRGCTRPTMPFGAMMTKATSSTPTSSRLTADEMVTVATCCSVPSRIAPTTAPTP